MEHFPGLRVLDMSSNSISSMQGIQTLGFLESLNLEDNKIAKLQCLEYCQRLKKLYIGRNYIRKLEGLQFCMSLQELSASHQRFTEGEYFLIDQESMLGISDTLISLELNDVRCRSIENLQYLRKPIFDHRISEPLAAQR